MISPLLKPNEFVLLPGFSRSLTYQLIRQGGLHMAHFYGTARIRPIELETFKRRNSQGRTTIFFIHPSIHLSNNHGNSNIEFWHRPFY